jgi:putative endonuclease
MQTMTPWFLYLIRTADNKLYTGITTDVERRYQQHQSGKGAKALRGKGELTLAFSAPVGDRPHQGHPRGPGAGLLNPNLNGKKSVW